MELLKSVPKSPPKPNTSSLDIQRILLFVNCIRITEARFQEETHISARENGAKRNFCRNKHDQLFLINFQTYIYIRIYLYNQESDD